MSFRLTRIIVAAFFLPILLGSAPKVEEKLTSEYQAIVALLEMRVIESIEFDVSRRHVKHLVILTSRFRDKHLVHLMQFKNIESLQLRVTYVTNDGLKQVSQLQSLRSLNLRQNRMITSQGIAHLKRLKGLTTLKLADKLFLGAKFDNSILKTVKELPNLTSLTINAHHVTDEGVPDLQDMKQLRRLNIKYTGITVDGLRQLQEALPNCTIQR